VSAQAVWLKRYRFAQVALGRFYKTYVMRLALVWGVFFGLSITSSALGFTKAYTTAHARAVLAHTFASNVGLKVLLGPTNHIDSVGGFTVWRSLGTIIIISSIWAILTATKYFRGEEAAGRWELFLTGQTTARRAAANMLLALGAGLATIYVVTSVITMAIGRSANVGFTIHASLFFGLAVISSGLIFLTAGTLASQIMPLRSRAATVTAGFFGLCFGLRAIANAAPSVHWLTNVSPLGWVDNLQPLVGSQPLWLLPIVGLAAVFIVLTLWLAGRRDLYASVVSDKDTAKPRLKLLNSPLGAAFRLTRTTIIGWLIGISAISFVFGFVAKSAGQAFKASANVGHVVARLSHQTQITGSVTFLGVIFMIVILLTISMTASSIGAIRDDEAQGYVDNFLVRAVGRLQWLWGRLLLLVLSIAAAGILAGCFSWLSVASQHSDVSFRLLLLSGINAMAPAFFCVGLGVLLLGFRPRMSRTAIYAVVSWSFLLEIIGSAINLNHWILDTSLLQHIALAPATNPNWGVVLIYSGLGLASIVLGSLGYRYRDLEAE
jgi:ABC-2 type transport system permease protein